MSLCDKFNCFRSEKLFGESEKLMSKLTNKQIRENYFELMNVADEVLHSTNNGKDNDFWEALPSLAETMDKITGQTLEQRWK